MRESEYNANLGLALGAKCVVRPATRLAEVVTVCVWPNNDWCEAHELEEALHTRSDDYVKLSVAIYTTDDFYERVEREVTRYNRGELA